MKKHEVLALFLAVISTYLVVMLPLMKQVFIDAGIMQGYIVIAVLCLTAVVWFTIVDFVRGLLGRR